MKDYTELENDILNYIKNAAEISPVELADLLTNIVSKISSDIGDKTSSYKGIATTGTNPGTPSGMVFYFATAAGTYTYFKDALNTSLVLTDALTILSYTGVYWTATVFSVDLSDYVSDTDLAVSMNYPFDNSPNMANYTALKTIIKDASLSVSNLSKRYYVGRWTYHQSGNNFIIEVRDKDTGALSALFSNANWSPSQNFQVIELEEQNTSGLTLKLLIDTSQLSAVNLTGLAFLQTMFSYRTYTLFSDLVLSKYPKMLGTENNDFSIVDGLFSNWDSNGRKASIPKGDELAGTANFHATDTSVEVVIPGATANDVYAVNIAQSTFSNREVLGYVPSSGKLTIYRTSGDTSGLKVSWVRIMKY